jgi:hypothetical protein
LVKFGRAKRRDGDIRLGCVVRSILGGVSFGAAVPGSGRALLQRARRLSSDPDDVRHLHHVHELSVYGASLMVVFVCFYSPREGAS